MSKPPALRRIQADIRELAMDPSDQYTASPLEDDMFEWHFTIRGATDTDFDGGVYHGRILLPSDYPFKPPHIVFLTPSGRFETGVKVCLSFSAHHPELWQPAWGIRLILEALISFLPTPADGAIGALDWSSSERKKLAKQSVNYCCPSCGLVKDLIPEVGSIKTKSSKSSTSRFQAEIAKLKELQALNEAGNKKDSSSSSGDYNATENEAKAQVATTSTEPQTPRNDEGVENENEDKKIAATESSVNEPTNVRPPVIEDNSTRNSGSTNNFQSTSIGSKESESSQLAANSETDDTISQTAATVPSTSTLGAATTSVRDDISNATLPVRSTSEEQPAGNTSAVSINDAAVIDEVQPPSEKKEIDPILTDPIVHAICVCFVAIIVILYRKIQSLLTELRALEDEEIFSSS